MIVVGVEADLLRVEGFGAGDVRHRHLDQLDLHLHVGFSSCSRNELFRSANTNRTECSVPLRSSHMEADPSPGVEATRNAQRAADGVAGPSGRRAQAARNDAAILEAARAVFIANPSAPIAEVAKRAGVGISALYRRYASKEALLHELCAD